MAAPAHEGPETMTESRAEPPCLSENGPGLDEVLWQAWKAMELPEGYRAEIIEGAIEVSPTGRFSHGQIINLLRDDLVLFLKDGDFAAWSDFNVIHKGERLDSRSLHRPQRHGAVRHRRRGGDHRSRCP
ncbi:hypothetical protein AB0D14_29440 [Streptomyces sp. NPDC048484]|uniref:hypothetical protein n=1 Tax=Streptomyces sp. NPDC048484 TaxID=3155146 RepID=UPI00344431EC